MLFQCSNQLYMKLLSIWIHYNFYQLKNTFSPQHVFNFSPFIYLVLLSENLWNKVTDAAFRLEIIELVTWKNRRMSAKDSNFGQLCQETKFWAFRIHKVFSAGNLKIFSRPWIWTYCISDTIFEHVFITMHLDVLGFMCGRPNLLVVVQFQKYLCLIGIWSSVEVVFLVSGCVLELCSLFLCWSCPPKKSANWHISACSSLEYQKLWEKSELLEQQNNKLMRELSNGMDHSNELCENIVLVEMSRDKLRAKLIEIIIETG